MFPMWKIGSNFAFMNSKNGFPANLKNRQNFPRIAKIFPRTVNMLTLVLVAASFNQYQSNFDHSNLKMFGITLNTTGLSRSEVSFVDKNQKHWKPTPLFTYFDFVQVCPIISFRCIKAGKQSVILIRFHTQKLNLITIK